ncbi:MAG: hypothetical protein ACLFTA_01085 [Candidatus Nanohaloarchaea archaeon]
MALTPESIMTRAATNFDLIIGAAVLGFLAGKMMMKRKIRRGGMMGGMM